MLPLGVPFLDLKRGYPAERARIENLLSEVAASGQYLFGPKLAQFEKDFADYHRVDRELTVACHSGTDALILSLLAAGIGPGQEVIMPANSAVATAAAIVNCGAKPVFCDVEAESHLMLASDCLNRISQKTKAIIPVHLYGNAFDVKFLQNSLEKMGRSDIHVIEDAAQAQGARLREQLVGTMGNFGAFSFFPTKNLAAMGDGGAVVCAKKEDANKVRATSFYGQLQKNIASLPNGINSRLDEFQAAILSFRLGGLRGKQKEKNALMALYTESLRNLPLRLPKVAEGTTPAWHLCVVTLDRSTDRDPFRTHLQSRGIETMIHYPHPLHRHPAYACDGESTHLPNAESLSSRIVSLPFSAFHSPEEIKFVVSAIRAYFSA